MDKFTRLLLVSGMIGYMSCESTQISLSQVWFKLKMENSSVEICPILQNLNEL
jgi:hypothetical protein